MPLVSVTRLRLRSALYLPAFMYRTWRSFRQLKRSNGLRIGALAGGVNRTFWTITVWEDEKSMRAYRNTAAHMKAMPKLLDWCDEASVTHWEQESAELPDAAEAQRRMIAEGRLSKVRHPSPDHVSQRLPAEAPPRISLRVVAHLALAALALTGCSRDVEPPADPPAPTESRAAFDPTVEDASIYFSALEDDLLRRRELQIFFEITSEGAFSASLAGELILEGDSVALTSTGTFGADAVDLSLRTAGGRLVGGNGAATFDEPVPPGLRESLVIGLTRMGLLHNLARLVSGSPPDRADGTVRSWVEAVNVEWQPSEEAGGGNGLAFQIQVSGELAGDVVLWLDQHGQPVRRAQTVRFTAGDMQVTEAYAVR